MRIIILGILFISGTIISFISSEAEVYDLNFPQEFIRTYDLTKRDTHEYNPYTLKKTRKSFLELESSLKEAGFLVEGRFGIFGYQEEAIPPYATNWEREAIVDEVIVKTNAGFSQPTKNVFGFMTGFLLKDAEWLQRSWFNYRKPRIMHILARPIDIFNDSSLIFQKHAFGKDYDMLIESRDRLERIIYTGNLKNVLAELIDFWTGMEERATKTASEEAVATQDMLFSIDYARALLEGQASILKFFIGPDITYPIEVLSCQKEEATLHAQSFIKKFDHELIPIADSNTAFIFCSFVDGVGKSTLLNNITNWRRHGDNFNEYERCDNSSSQEATVFKLKDKVFIADLPAQISHFVIKPDGFVYTDVQTVKEMTSDLLTRVIAYIKKNKLTLIADYQNSKEKIAVQDKALYEIDNPIENYAHNCLTLNVSNEQWIPIMYEEHNFLFDKNNSRQLRVLVPLGNAHSTGLKVVEPEQMLFAKGLSLPMRYKAFTQNLIDKLKQAGVERIVFVDFLSMYPRSSRENIRLNFVLQYLKRIFKDSYSIASSFYQPRVHDAQELCYMLHHHLDNATHTLVLETALRWALDILLEKKPSDSVSNTRGAVLEQDLQALTSSLLENHSKDLYTYAYERLEHEKAVYYNNYQLDRIYETISCFSLSPIIEFSKLMFSLFTQHTNSSYFNTLWLDLDKQLISMPTISNISLPFQTLLDGGAKVEVIHRMHGNCREEVILREFTRKIRAQWYAALSNLLTSVYNTDGYYEFTKIDQPVPPLVIQTNSDGYAYSIQKSLPLIDTKTVQLLQPIKFNVINRGMNARRWGLFDKLPHCLEWNAITTHTGLYAYSYQSIGKKSLVTRTVDSFRQLCIRSGKPNLVMPVSDLYKVLLSNDENISLLQTELKSKKFETLPIGDPRIASLRLWVRMIATLDMILKDTESKIVVRKGNKEDFVAAVQLLESITLPYYFGIKAEEPLFEDYASLEPVLSWEIINCL